MAENSLSPASVKINYHSAFGAHAMTIPTLAWLPTNITGILGSYQAWDLTSIDGEAMINALVDKLKVFMVPAVQFDLATIYTQATSTSDNIPQRSAVLTQVGTSAATGFTEAQSTTFNFKTLANGDVKLVLLDTPIGGAGFNAILPAGFVADITNLATEFEAVSNAWSGRDDTRPAVLRKVTFDLNDKLQKLYRMSG